MGQRSDSHPIGTHALSRDSEAERDPFELVEDVPFDGKRRLAGKDLRREGHLLLQLRRGEI